MILGYLVMKEHLGMGIGGLCSVIIIGMILLFTFRGCQNASESYYEMSKRCIAGGGSFVPTTGWFAVCAMPAKTTP